MLLILAIACALVLYWLQSFIYARYWNRHLNVKIHFEHKECIEGESNTLIEIITNNKSLPLPMLHVKLNTPRTFLFKNEENSSVTDYYYRDDVFSVMGNQQITRNLNFMCSRRGCYYMNDLSLVCYDLFMQKTFNDNAPNSNIIYVYPAKIDVSAFDIPFNTITGSYATQRTLVEDPFEFRGIRPYQPYDNIRNINWKSSARNNILQVNTFFMTSSQTVHILLNLDTHLYSKSEILVETAIRIASSLSEKFIRTEIPVSVTSNGIDRYTGSNIYQPAGQGNEHMKAIDISLARIDTSCDNSSFVSILRDTLEHSDNYSYYIIISNSRTPELVKCYNELTGQGISCYFIVPEYKDVNIEKDFMAENISVTDMSGIIKWEVEQ